MRKVANIARLKAVRPGRARCRRVCHIGLRLPGRVSVCCGNARSVCAAQSGRRPGPVVSGKASLSCARSASGIWPGRIVACISAAERPSCAWPSVRFVRVGRYDRNFAIAKRLIDFGDAPDRAPDERSRTQVILRLRRRLELVAETAPHQSARFGRARVPARAPSCRRVHSARGRVAQLIWPPTHPRRSAGLLVSPWSGIGANHRRQASGKACVLPRQNHSLVICIDSRCHPAPARLINGNNRGAMPAYAHSDHQ